MSNKIVFVNYAVFIVAIAVLTLVARPHRARNLILLLFMPGGIIGMAVTLDFFARKEAFFLSVFSVVALLSVVLRRIPAPRLRRVALAALLVSSFLLGLVQPLVHEAFLFLSAPAWLVLLLSIVRDVAPDQRKRARLQKSVVVAYAVSGLLLFLVLGHFHGNARIAQAIWDGLNPADRYAMSPDGQITGGIAAIALSFTRAIYVFLHVLISGLVWLWIVPVLGIALYCFGLVTVNIQQSDATTDFRKWLRLYVYLYICVIPLFILGSDWGRWIATVNSHFLILWLALSHTSAMDELTPFPPAWLLRLWPGVYIERFMVRYMEIVRRHPYRTQAILLLFAITFRLTEGAMEPVATNYAVYEAHHAAGFVVHHLHGAHTGSGS